MTQRTYTGIGGLPKRPLVFPLLACEKGHRWRTVLPASFEGQPCSDCGEPLTRICEHGHPAKGDPTAEACVRGGAGSSASSICLYADRRIRTGDGGTR